jgi:hypothetical protein
MLMHQTLSKGWCRDGSGLLLGLIVRVRGRLVEAQALLGATENRSACTAHRLGGHHSGHPRPVASVLQRARLLALRLLSPALLLPRPVLPEPTQSAHPRPRARAARSLQLAFAREIAEPEAVYHVLDTTLIPAIVRVRASRKGLFCGQATFGRSASKTESSKTEWIYGFKMALTVSPQGVITAFGVAEAASDERPIGDWLIRQDRHDIYLADKGFSSVAWERHWAQNYGALVVATPKDNSKRAWPESDRRWAAGKRQIIEGVIDQLKDIFALERHRAKTLGGLLARLAAKVAAYTCGQRINVQLCRPLRQLADLLI